LNCGSVADHNQIGSRIGIPSGIIFKNPVWKSQETGQSD
jgi:hypothetical protein